MPNHVHGIIMIDRTYDGRDCRDAINRVSTEPNDIGGFSGNKNPMLHNNVPRVLRWYKGRVSFESRKIHARFAWQPRFYDHIIRSEKSYYIVSEYIISNPLKWNNDALNPDKKEGN